MCGVLGAFLRKGLPNQDVRIRSALRALQHRGPDDSGAESFPYLDGCLILGHTRLSIIDLSDAGHQPFHSADGRYVIIYNGEIYNYRELRSELTSLGYVFRTESDTEVLLTAWTAWGRDCLCRLIGMFSFAVLDRQEVALTCVRDAFGIKPLFYTEEDGNFIFSSEIRALTALKLHKAEVNWQRSYDYLVHGEYDNSEETFFADVKQLPSGHFMTLDLTEGAAPVLSKWWAPQITERIDLSPGEAAERIRECFLNSVRLHLRSDVALGVALSGGIDSSAVACAMRYVDPQMPINTFSFVARGSPVDEERWVDIVNQKIQAKAHKLVIAPGELVRDIDDLIHAQGEPFGSMSIYAQYRVNQLASSSGVRVTLDGQGADEILGGYTGFPGERAHSLLDERRLGAALSFIGSWAKWPGRSKASGLRALLAELSTGSVHELMRWAAGMNRVPSWVIQDTVDEMNIAHRVGRFRSGSSASGRRMVAQMANMLTKHGLPALLRHGDRNSMRFSVESRVPFLSVELVELMLSMPENYLVSARGETKHIFREAMRGIVPDEVLFRKDKIGFEPPEKEWILSIAGKVREWLSEDVSIPFIHRDVLLTQFDEVVAGRRPFTWQVWRWINFYRWRACLTV
ncbi:asparagine synthase (glutamine-hydrolyzing) [Castellaniella sp.]|uniref:asparagine synthase (glutamine-hydrolyzing) n=1 Tax=Castellaniella sp. TaxID=1955812 RepID=UPI002AFF5CBE|nr:asparagine synthase (glutamine-hydrolyzing) [Castellaniella sp.]